MHENRPRQHSRFMFMHTIHTYSIPTNIYPVCIKGCSHKDDTGCSDNWKKYSYMYHIYRISYLHWQSEPCVCVCVEHKWAALQLQLSVANSTRKYTIWKSTALWKFTFLSLSHSLYHTSLCHPPLSHSFPLRHWQILLTLRWYCTFRFAAAHAIKNKKK